MNRVRRLAALDQDVVALEASKHIRGPFQELVDHPEMHHHRPARLADSRGLRSRRGLGLAHFTLGLGQL
jgi:hypothetical protein